MKPLQAVLMPRLPQMLVALRALCAPAIWLASWLGASGTVLTAMLTIGFVSDVCDGIIARRFGVATPCLRRADSLADMGFYCAAGAAVFVRSPEVLRSHVAGLIAIAVLELLRLGVDCVKFGRKAPYHMWSAKLWGITLSLGISEVFLMHNAGLLVSLAIRVGIAADIEGLMTSLILSRWHHDVPTVWHACAIELSRIARLRVAGLRVSRGPSERGSCGRGGA